jgi:ketosteroid isomerase-like protein
MKVFTLLFSLLILLSCNNDLSNQAKIEIAKAEHDFDSITKVIGVKEAFVKFADDSSVFLRGNTLIKGKNEILKFYTNWQYKDVSLEWHPDFIDAAKSGDLGYTYGKYTFKGTDSSGKRIVRDGVFHTVWKKNKNAEWKVAWD